ncbi:DUF5615 family PIN-like protein [Candidatus Gottesmanbacteria bacterium]|nr:DUF5615 family PIN-like protein [Candidatus Gottesmanbacteria bacterium]
MKFLTDENIGFAVVAFLRKRGHDISSITELSPGVSDASVLLCRGYRNDHSHSKDVVSLKNNVPNQHG